MSIIQSKIVKFNRKWSNLVEKDGFSIKINKFWIKFNYSRSEFESNFEFGPRFQIVATISMDVSNKFGSKMLIKTQFECD